MIVRLLLLCAVLTGNARAKLPDHFFPIQPSRATTLQNDTSDPIPLSVNFTLFGKTTNYVIVNKDGLISFPHGVTESFPIRSGHLIDGSILSVFWTNILLNAELDSGKVQYLEFTNKKMLNKAKDKINSHFQCEETFEPESVLIVTWHNVRTRYDCVKDHSIEFCDCLEGGKSAEYCLCKMEHSASYCDASCTDTSPPGTLTLCNCLDEHDDYDYCECIINNFTDCSCLRDHDKAYCDCLVSNSPQFAWNCSCFLKYDERYCECLLKTDENHDYCACAQVWRSHCECYLYRSKSFCDCFRLDRKGNEGYCDCIEQGKDFTLCTCIHELYPTFYYDTYMVETYCDCVASRYGIEEFRSHLATSYCTCAAQQDPSTCEEDKKRDSTPTCLENAKENNLVKAKGSTFQAVLISGGGRSFVIYNYGYFSSGIEDISLKKLNLRYYSAFLVANEPIWPRVNTYVDLAFGYGHYSTNTPWCLLESSNAGVPGQFMYRTDQAQLEEPNCSMRGYNRTVSY